MARINLLPWREERRQQKTRQFIFQAVAAVVVAALIGGLGWHHASRLVEEQEARNAYLEDEIAAMRQKIREIEEIDAQREDLSQRIEVIQDLQQRRPQVVHLFDQIARRLPEGVHLVRIEQGETWLTLRGRAESNTRVSTLMRNLNASDWLESAEVEVIETDQQDRVSAFTLHVSQTAPQADGEDS